MRIKFDDLFKQSSVMTQSSRHKVDSLTEVLRLLHVKHDNMVKYKDDLESQLQDKSLDNTTFDKINQQLVEEAKERKFKYDNLLKQVSDQQRELELLRIFRVRGSSTREAYTSTSDLVDDKSSTAEAHTTASEFNDDTC